ncbi:manganese catalase family protein [Paenibacillus polymyxa]|uniref:manganese catalase family protein n=1 Tax=Paenibacillus polymyxa TaxID=1406 RepID=UPI003D7AA3E4
MTDNPVVREIVGYLLVRGGVHVMAYTKALEKLTGVEMTKMLPIPNLENEAFSETRKFEEKGLHRTIYRFSPNNYKEIDKYGAAFTRKMDNNLKKSKTTKLLPSERYSLVFSSVRLYTMPILLQKYD